MLVTGQDLAEVMQCAWKDAVGTNKILDCARKEACYCEWKERPDRGPGHNMKSRIWVCSLARQFKLRYTRGTHNGHAYRVFWRDNESNQKHFSLNELLFDISVCGVEATESFATSAHDLEFVSDCYWQIESEFNKSDSRQVVVDMSKLVLGSAQNKLMIASHRCKKGGVCSAGATNKDVLRQCAPIASRCNGNVYFSFVSHPNEWGEDHQVPAVHAWTPSGWTQMAGSPCCGYKGCTNNQT